MLLPVQDVIYRSVALLVQGLYKTENFAHDKKLDKRLTVQRQVASDLVRVITFSKIKYILPITLA